MFETLPRNRSKKDLVLVALLAVTLGAFTAKLASGPATHHAASEQRAAAAATVAVHG